VLAGSGSARSSAMSLIGSILGSEVAYTSLLGTLLRYMPSSHSASVRAGASSVVCGAAALPSVMSVVRSAIGVSDRQARVRFGATVYRRLRLDLRPAGNLLARASISSSFIMVLWPYCLRV
jgi:hypothetical protein